MIPSISWSQYFLFLGLATTIYYLVIWVVVFKAKVPVFSNSDFRVASFRGEDEPDELLTTTQHIINELRPVFNGRTNKNELMMALQKKLEKYTEWDEPGFRETINDFIASESDFKCSIRLGEEDQRALWL
jgi:hypothetical protein